MGIRCELRLRFNFTYEAKFENNLTEHEFDYVYAGICNDIPLPDPSEVGDWKYADISTIEKQIKESPEQFTEWFKLIFDRINTGK